MKRGSTLFLRGTIILLGIGVLALCIFVLPVGMRDGIDYRPVIIGMYIAAIPFFVALYQGLKLLGFIDKNNVFSVLAIKALKYIKYCAVTISILYVLEMPFIYIAAEKDDAPGAIVIGLVIMFASFVIATFAAVLQKLIQNAVDIKAENDLTV